MAARSKARKRAVDVLYEADADHGQLKFKGWYFGGVARF